jgi:predicted DNA-binding protein YlxM (UPF0122 family)
MAEMAEEIRKTAGAKRTAGAESDIANIELQSLLFDFYGALLNESQNEVMALYHEDNLSPSEIAEDLGMSRQAVHYTLKKAEKALNGYEDKLGLVAEYHRNRELAERAREIIAGSQKAIGAKSSEELLSIIEEITE